MSSAKNYEPEFLPGFKADIEKYSTQKDKVQNKVRLILEHPYTFSHILKNKGGIDLSGYRSAHIGKGKFVILLELDEDNRKILFIAFGPHDEVYGAKT